MTLAVNLAQSGSNNVTFRNRIINGAMLVAQYGVGPTTLTNSPQFTADRFGCFRDNAGAVVTITQSSTAPSNFVKSLLWTTSTGATVGGNEDAIIRQQIEGLVVSDLGWGTSAALPVTLSFWVRSSITGTYGVSFGNAATSRGYMMTYTVNTANTWEQKSITIVGDTSGTWLTDNTTGIRLNFDMGCGTSRSMAASSAWGSTWAPGLTGGVKVIGTTGATFYITGVQLEAGTTASPFEYRQYGTELALCQRYYEQMTADSTSLLGGYGRFMTASSAGSGVAYAVYNFGVTKRTTPTFVYSGTYRWQSTAGSDSANTTSLTLVDARPYAISIYMNAGSGGTAGYGGAYQFMTSTSYIGFSAEL